MDFGPPPKDVEYHLAHEVLAQESQLDRAIPPGGGGGCGAAPPPGARAPPLGGLLAGPPRGGPPPRCSILPSLNDGRPPSRLQRRRQQALARLHGLSLGQRAAPPQDPR